MCGIAGEISLGTPVNLQRARPMINAILHRGPDELGERADDAGRVALLHCRLSIVDLKGGQQPMRGTSGDVTIVFNGEIYGFQTLRCDLERSGYRFASTSDTEVLIALYLRDGPGFVDQLEGEFAFVLYDGAAQHCLIARDRFGVKPLFYSIQNDLFLFGSEAKAILAHRFCERRLDAEVVHRRIHGALLPDETIFAGIKSVLPGHILTISADGTINSRQHARLDPHQAGTLQLDRPAAQAAFDEAFTAAVIDRLHGDVDIGIYLSGGVDSNLLGAVMRENSTQAHRAFTIGFGEPGYQEADDAATTAQYLNFPHEIEQVGPDDLTAKFVRSLWHSETNVVNTHGTAKLALSARAGARVKVILAGEGADEIHGGYAYYRHAALLQAASDKVGRRALQEFLQDNGPEDGVLSRASVNSRNALAAHSKGGVPYSVQRATIFQDLLSNLLTSDFRSQITPHPADQLIAWIDQYDPSARQILDDTTLSRFVSAITDMPCYNLTFMGDRSEMANSVEGRLPFLDKRVVDLLWSLPNDYHLGAQSKTLIRGALAKRLPGEAANRYKRMFVAPTSAANGLFIGPFAERWLSTSTAKSVGIFRPAWIHGLRKAYLVLPGRSPLRKVLESFLMTVLSVHVLHDLFIENFQASLETFQLNPANIPSHQLASVQ